MAIVVVARRGIARAGPAPLRPGWDRRTVRGRPSPGSEVADPTGWRARGSRRTPAALATARRDAVARVRSSRSSSTRSCSTCCRSPATTGRACSPRCCWRASSTSCVVAVGAPLGGAVLRRRARGLPRVVADDRAGHGAARRRRRDAARLGLGAPPGDRGRGARLRPPGRERAALRDRVGARAEFRANVDRMDTVKQGPDLYRTCVPGPDPRRAFCVLVTTDQVAARRHARPRPAAERDRQRPGQPGPAGALSGPLRARARSAARGSP